MKSSKRVFSFALAAAAVLAATGAHAQTALDDIMKAKEIKIAIPTDFPPYGMVGTDLKPQGLDVEMAGYIAQKLGVKIELVPVTSANRIAYLQTKKADLVISTLGKTPEREKVIDFTAAYTPFFQAVFGPKSMSVKSFADLNGKMIGLSTPSDTITLATLRLLAAKGIKASDFRAKAVVGTAARFDCLKSGECVAVPMRGTNRPTRRI